MNHWYVLQAKKCFVTRIKYTNKNVSVTIPVIACSSLFARLRLRWWENAMDFHVPGQVAFLGEGLLAHCASVGRFN